LLRLFAFEERIACFSGFKGAHKAGEQSQIKRRGGSGDDDEKENFAEMIGGRA